MISKPLDIRERTFRFALRTFRICTLIDETEKQFIITRQLARSAASVGANVREARNAENKNDFIHKLSIALKECDESIYWIKLLLELSKSGKDELLDLKNESDQIMRILSTLIIKPKANSKWIKHEFPSFPLYILNFQLFCNVFPIPPVIPANPKNP